MANVNLDKYFKKNSQIKSPVDSRIQLNKKQISNNFYGDLRLDLNIKEYKDQRLYAKQSNNDIQRIFNQQSVITSLKNIFNTRICSRILNPQISFDLREYLFEPITETKAWFIGYDIYLRLPQYQPRVKIKSLKIIPDPDNKLYTITLSLSIPSLDNKTIDISSILDSDGYSIISK